MAQEVPYSKQHYWSDGYRQDCSGFVSMAWKLTASETTSSLHQVSHRITKNELQAGDILLDAGSHVVIFEKWANADRTAYIGYEQTPPKTLHRQIPYPYWSGTYLPYRYDNVADAPVSAPEPPGIATVSTEFTKLDVFARDDNTNGTSNKAETHATRAASSGSRGA